MTNASDTPDPILKCRQRANLFRKNAQAVELRLAESRKLLWSEREKKNNDRVRKALEALVNQDQVLVQVLTRGAEALEEAVQG